MNSRSFKQFIKIMMNARIWCPSHAHLLQRHLIHKNLNRKYGFTDQDHLQATIAWLERAQDITGDGGVSGRYLLGHGWSSSYPETTGYIIPTFLALSKKLNSDRFTQRAQRAVNFLLSLQLPGGGFPGGEIHENTIKPSMFNTAQVVNGLIAWHAFSNSGQALEAARKAGDWLVSNQGRDGAWRMYTYNNVTTTYSAHASCWLAELGKYTGEMSYLDAAEKHFNWVLSCQDSETGWIDFMGFSLNDHERRQAVTHTIAYTLCGLLITSEILGREDGLKAVQKASVGIARRLELSGWLPGVLNHHWRARSTYACLTGNAQMALVWMRLYSVNGDTRFLNAAFKAIDLVKQAQPMLGKKPGIRGGVPGSYPIWGNYISLGLPNWAAKFFIDALLAKAEILEDIFKPLSDKQNILTDVPQSLPDITVTSSQNSLKVIMYTTRDSQRVQQMVNAWSNWNFKPDVVVIEKRPEIGLLTCLLRKIHNEGFSWISSRLFHVKELQKDQVIDGKFENSDVVTFCAEHGIPIAEVGELDSPETIATIRALKHDIAIQAGSCGILRLPLLETARLGTLNAHMGVLPQYRGMNVAEWTLFEGGPVGCAVHLIDPGIDTGDILCVCSVNTNGVLGIRDLRNRVDNVQIDLLGNVLKYILKTGGLPPQRKQTLEEGRQFFRMHSEIAAFLEEKLRKKKI